MMNTTLNDAQKITLAERLIADGVRFHDEQKALMAWFMKEHDIIFAQASTGTWLAKHKSTGVNIDKYPTFSVMLIDLIGRVTSARASS